MIRAVFQFEMLQAGRRQRIFFLRWLYAAFLLVQIAPIFHMSRNAWTRLLMSLDIYVFFEGFLQQHYVMLAILTPAMVGGAITEEKIRGTLQYLLTANIRPGELILGKLAAAVCQLMVLALVGLPLFCFFAALGNDPAFPFIVLVSSLAFVLGIGAVSILLSVWCRKTSDAVLCTFLAMGFVSLLVPWLPVTRWSFWLTTLHPLRVLALTDVGQRWQHLGEFLLAWGTLGLAGVFLASWRLRRAFRRQMEFAGRPRERWWHAPRRRVRGNPVQWREQHVVGITPLDALRGFPRWLGALIVMAVSAAGVIFLLVRFLPPTVKPRALLQTGDWDAIHRLLMSVAGEAFFWHGLAALVLLTLVVAIRASAAITAEKENGTWLALLLTPINTQKIISGKHWGIFWSCLPYVVAHGAIVLPLAGCLGLEALAWTILWTGSMLPAVIFGSAVGLWTSARAASSWRSLLTTLALFYLGWLLFMVPITLLLVVLKSAIEMALIVMSLFADTSAAASFVDSVSLGAVALCLALAMAFWVLTQRLLTAAAERVGRNDRTVGADFDYYYVYRDWYRKKEEELWASQRMESALAFETTIADGKAQEEPIPFQ